MKAEATADAAADIARQLPSDGLAMLLVFVSPFHDPDHFVAEMARRFARSRPAQAS